jgi:hypothetical protein
VPISSSGDHFPRFCALSSTPGPLQIHLFDAAQTEAQKSDWIAGDMDAAGGERCNPYFWFRTIPSMPMPFAML